MASQATKDGHEFTCDACGDVHQPPRLGRGSESRDWQQCWELAKADGWRAIKVKSRAGGSDTWEHRCQDCA